MLSLPLPRTQIDVNKKYVIYYAKTTYYFAVFLGVLLVAYVLMLLFGMFMAYQIKQNIRSFYNRYNDTPIVNLSSLLALTVSFGSLFLIILLTPTMGNVGVLLFLVALRDGSWMFPMLGLMYLPMVSMSPVCLCVCVCGWVGPCLRTCVHSCVHVFMHACVCLSVHACVSVCGGGRLVGVWREVGKRDDYMSPLMLHVVWPLRWTVLCADL